MTSKVQQQVSQLAVERQNRQPGAGNGQIAAAKAELTKRWLRRTFIVTAVVFVLAAAAAILFAAVWTQHNGPWSPARVGLVWAAPVTAAVIILVGLIHPGYDGGGVVGYVVGKDNRLSTSKTQVGLWTVAVVFAFFFFTIQLIRTSDPHSLDASFAHFGPEYLLLLGGPFAAAVLAQATTATKTADGSVQQIPADKPSTADLVTDHDGQPAISDAQYFLFNLVALSYFAVALARSPDTLPSLPATLVGLTSVSALTYLGAKVVTADQPTLTNIVITSTPSDGYLHAGDTIKIIGSGFTTPASQPEHDDTVGVLFGNVEVLPDKLRDTVILATVPRGLTGTADGNLDITVRTAGGLVITPPYTKLAIKGPTITSATREDAALTVTGYGLWPGTDHFKPTVTATGADASYAVNDVHPLATSNGLQCTLVPRPAGPVNVTVAVDGLSSDAVTPT